MNQTYHIRALVRALTPIAHFGESTGTNAAMWRTENFFHNGVRSRVPVFSGNAIRGVWRRSAMRYALQTIAEARGQSPTVLLPVFHFLFSGGSLTKDTKRGVDMDMERELRDLFPAVSLFGGALGRRILPGKLHCGRLVPICAETSATLAQVHRDRPMAQVVARQLYDDAQYTRMDPTRSPDADLFLADLTLAAQPHTLLTSMPDGKEVTKAAPAGESQQMIYRLEVLASGVEFSHECSLIGVSDLEYEAFVSALLTWMQEPRIGGKGNIGYGLVEYQPDGWHVSSPLDRGTSEVGLRFGEAYTQHLQQHADTIVARLQEWVK